ncbi:MAG: HsdR family type I site-specific deoxyribonuclease [Pyrinomonadaceae bacterium]
MEVPSFKEDHISQIPALQMLQKIGWTYLTPAEADRMRGGKTSNVLLEDILRNQLKVINSEKRISSTRTTYISDANIENGIRVLRDLPMNEGYITACETAYNLLTLGRSFEQNVDGDIKSFTLQYIDWKDIRNNVFHVAEEFSVMRSTTKEHYRPDIVLFINGIPFCIIECKRPDMKEPLKQAISQQLRSQQEDGIRSLYVYTQLLLSIATQEAAYATNATPEKFWSQWKEKFATKTKEKEFHDKLSDLRNTPLSEELSDRLFEGRFKYVRDYFEALEQKEIRPTIQDEYIFGMCRPARLLDLAFSFVIFDDGAKKIARYQQFFAIKKTIDRIRSVEGGKRRGGVIWHTQGSGKSLTMVMLAQAIAMEPSIRNPKIVLVTDRTDLDSQITGTFRKCGMPVDNAATGQRLVELLESKSDAVVTTIVNKFAAAVKKIKVPLESPDIFVLVDEGHRTQHGTFNIEMQKTLPNACYIAMTGTPLFKKDKNTAAKFGGMIDTYTVDEAVKDKAVVPLLYEGRLARQEVSAKPLDNYFAMISESMTREQKADLKKKFARADQLNAAEQKIYAIAWDISLHYRDNWQGTGFKAQLVCDKKLNAIRYKEFLDQIGLISSDVLISPIDEREGEDSAFEKSDLKENRFWNRMMEEHGNAKTYEKNIISRFKNQKDPEIVIVVDKLLTGFDEPKNTVLYLTRKLQNHKLLQAIARVNRVAEDKEFGYVIDYYGVIEGLSDALEVYSALGEFDESDVEGTLFDIAAEIEKLPQKYSELWDIFKEIENKRDAEGYQLLLKQEDKRALFYSKLAEFAKCLKIALSSIEFHRNTEGKTISRYREDLTMFLKLRLAVMERYSDAVDFRQYEGQIQKLIDTHVTTEKVEIITELVNIFDKDKFQQEVENTIGTAAKADKIASRTAKHITEKMDEDPAFYKKFSQMLRETIEDYEAKRIDEAQYLARVQEIMDSVLSGTDSDIPEILAEKDVAKAFYGVVNEELRAKFDDSPALRQISADSALEIDRIMRPLIKVDWQREVDIPKRMILLIGDYLIDEVRDKYHVAINFEEIDRIAEACVEIAKLRYKQ